LIDFNKLKKYDAYKMYEIYDKWPEMAKEAYTNNHKIQKIGKISHIVFIGMGGSGAIGDIFNSMLSRTKIHVSVIKGYMIPKTVNSETLVVPISISGNTVETLSSLESAIEANAKILAFTGGGKMKEFCIKNNIDHRQIAMIHSPRASFTIFLFSMLKILESILPISKTEIFEALKTMENTRELIFSKNMTNDNPAMELAKYTNQIPIIYYPFGLESAAIRFKNSLQENAKIHAMAEDVIEACHNGIVSWEKKSKVKPILIEGEDDHIKTKERWVILKGFFEMNSIEYLEIKSVKGGILSKIINLIYLLDYASIYLALLSKTDPTPVKSIEFVKKNL
jgi:glucose/mannose-6-phosphate isomerase